MKRFQLFLVLALVAAPLGAEIYRSVGPDGNVVFSDQPSRGAKPVDLPPLPTYTPRALPESAPALEKPSAYYKTLRILKPVNDETVIDNNGVIDVNVLLEPPLRVNADHRMLVKLDDTELAAQGMTIRFSNVDRGTHTVSVRVQDHSGKTLIRSEPVIVHLRRPSRLMPGRKSGSGG